MSNSGYVQARMDYTAYGEEIGSGTGRRTTAQGFGSSNTPRQKYGLTERDEASQSFTFAYDISNRLISRAMPNGVTTTYDYDGMSRLVRLKDDGPSGTLFDRQYSYNSAGQISQIVELTGTRMFGYDNLDRLTSVTGSVAESYLFDAVGNRTSSHLSSTYSYHPFNQLTSTASSTQNFDANGNTISRSEGSNFWRYTWDYENRLAEAATRKQKVRYKYDALGRRVSRNLGYGKENTKFTYDGEDVVMDDDSGVLTKYQNGLGIDNKLKSNTGSNVSYFLTDHQLSTYGLTNLAGSVTSAQSFDSYGNASNNTFPSRYQYTGREYDSFTGLYFYRARMYDARAVRFLSEDPIGFAGGINLYAYVGNNPTQFTDPLGLFPSIWPWPKHQKIGSDALNGLATPDQIKAFNNSNQTFDLRTQDSIYAPYHAMRRPGQTASEARDEPNEFVRHKICLARNYDARGLPPIPCRIIVPLLTLIFKRLGRIHVFS